LGRKLGRNPQGEISVQEIDRKSPEAQAAFAMAALAVAFARTLHELAPQSDSLAILQSKAQVEHSRLRQSPDTEVAAAMLRFVIDSLRNPAVLKQPDDD
jgi:hypothetical protein